MLRSVVLVAVLAFVVSGCSCGGSPEVDFDPLRDAPGNGAGNGDAGADPTGGKDGGPTVTLPTAGPDVRMCAGGSVTLGPAAQQGLRYAWSPAAGLSATDVAQPTASPGATTTYTLTVSDVASGTVRDSQVTVAVQPLPVVRVTTASGTPVPAGACTGATLALSGATSEVGAPASLASYLWTLPDGSTDTADVLELALGEGEGTRSIGLTVTDSLGCSASASVPVEVSQSPGLAGDDSYLARGGSTAIGPSPLAGASYAWTCNREDCALSDPAAAQPVAQPLHSTRYTLTATNGACVEQSGRTVWVELDARTIPADGAVAYPVSAALEVHFSEPVDPVSLGTSQLALVDASSGAPVSVTFELDASGRVLTLHPSGGNYVAGTDYELTLAHGLSGIVSLDPVLPDVLGPTVVTYTTSDPDTTPPGLTYRSPAVDELGVEPNRAVVATFDEPVATATVNAGTFRVVDAGGMAVPGEVRYDAASQTATFRPSGPLAYDAAYTVQLAGVADLSGNAGSTSWSFTTGAEPDTTPPQVTAVSPADGATGVLASAQLRFTFSEAVDAASLAGITLTHVASGTRVAGTVTYDGTTRVATFTPRTLLEGSSSYALAVSGVRDLAGNAMAAAFESAFTTAVTLFSDTFEGGLAKWSTPPATSGASWSLVTNQYASATHSFTDSPRSKYARGVDSSARLASPIDVTDLGSVTVQAAVRTNLARGPRGTTPDAFTLEYSLDGGATWTALQRWVANSAWARHTLALPLPEGSTQLLLRTHLVATGTRMADGAYVDDVVVQTP